ncbi:hypothetical protein ACEZDB_24055 [Streptacidiphilus sp. N1-3]|uniref:Streptomyces killer toxin-like beta/gamma crystallin domain-containing protein n=1 Tax=Streptacidiphilus alkalitolerans TaxID=3342712 RepID=A0ABV6X5Z6_9ACTN
MNVRRKLAAAVLTGGVLAGGIAMAAPASAITQVSCPTQGITIYYSGGHKAYCYAGSVGYGYADIQGVTRVTSGVNNGEIRIEDPNGDTSLVFFGHPYDHSFPNVWVTGVWIN